MTEEQKLPEKPKAEDEKARAKRFVAEKEDIVFHGKLTPQQAPEQK